MKPLAHLCCVLFAVASDVRAETLSPQSLLPKLPDEIRLTPYPVRPLSEGKGNFGWGIKGEGLDCSLGIVLHPTEEEARAAYQEAIDSEGRYPPEKGPIGEECLIVNHSPELNVTQIESLRGTTVVRMIGVISPETAEEVVRRVDGFIVNHGLEPYQKVIREALPVSDPVPPPKPKVLPFFGFEPPLPDVIAEFGEGLVMEHCIVRGPEMQASFREAGSPEDRLSPARKEMGIMIRAFDSEQAAEEGVAMFMPAVTSGFPEESPYGNDGIFFRYKDTVRTTVYLRFRRGLVHVSLSSDERLEADFLDRAEKVNQFLERTPDAEVAALIVKHTPKPPPREELRELRWGSMTNEDFLTILRGPNDTARTDAIARLAKREIEDDDAEAFGQALVAIAKDDSKRSNRTFAIEALGDVGWKGSVPYLRSLIDIDPAAVGVEEESLARHMTLQRLGALDSIIKIEGIANHREFLERIANDPDESPSFREQIRMRLEMGE